MYSTPNLFVTKWYSYVIILDTIIQFKLLRLFIGLPVSAERQSKGNIMLTKLLGQTLDVGRSPESQQVIYDN